MILPFPATQDFIESAISMMLVFLTNAVKDSHTEARVSLVLNLWSLGHFFKVGDTDTQPIQTAVERASGQDLRFGKHLEQYFAERDISRHLVISNGFYLTNISALNMRQIVAFEAMMRANIALFPGCERHIYLDDECFKVNNDGLVLICRHNNLGIVEAWGSGITFPITLDLDNFDPNPFVKFAGSSLESAILKNKARIMEALEAKATNPPPNPPPLSGAQLIAQERERQMSEEGYHAEHDDKLTHQELRKLAACYACEYELFATVNRSEQPRRYEFRAVLPSGFEIKRVVPYPLSSDHGKQIKDLTKAGALIAAEIDRLQRALAKKPQS